MTRAAIITAANARDYVALAALIPDSVFTFSYGSGDSAIDYWKDLEAARETPLENHDRSPCSPSHAGG
jgi:hypothetical protein